MTQNFFTIGHSTRSIAEFVDLLRASKIELVVDVRHIPRSRTNPQFNREGLPEQLHRFQIGYVHLASLGGLRKRARRIETSPNLFWENSSFRNYADYALTEEFHNGLTALRDLGHKQRTVVMYAEAVWWRCHRRIIADYLICAGESVFHILGYDRVDRALLTPGAICQLGGLLVIRHASERDALCQKRTPNASPICPTRWQELTPGRRSALPAKRLPGPCSAPLDGSARGGWSSRLKPTRLRC